VDYSIPGLKAQGCENIGLKCAATDRYQVGPMDLIMHGLWFDLVFVRKI